MKKNDNSVFKPTKKKPLHFQKYKFTLKTFSAAACVTALFILLASSCAAGIKEYARTEVVLGTVCRIRILTEKTELESEGILDSAFTELERLESVFSANCRDGDTSELEKVNRLAGIAPLRVSDELYELVKTALFFAEKTDGAFNPAIGPLVKLWNIGFTEAALIQTDDNPADKKKLLVPEPEKINSILPLLDYRDIILKDNTVFLRKKGMRLDLGGIAKGYAADKTAALLIEAGIKNALIDLGGNILTIGKNPAGENWKIGIKNPIIGKTGSVMTVALTDTSLVASGNYERYFEQDGILYHHILDWRTGYPAKTDVNAVSVICKDSVFADALSTACFVLGSKNGKALLHSLPEIKAAVFFFLKENKILPTANSEKNFIEFKITDKEFSAEEY